MKKILYSLIIFTLVISCQKEENFMTEIPEYENPSESKSIEEILTSKAVIGKKLPNPYSVDIMKQAFNNLKMETKSGLSEDCIEATHHYIVFKPSCHAHYRSLIMDEELDFYPYPLDHEVSDGWVVLDPDPEYSTNGYQHRWGYVPVEKDLSHIECPYEILYDIYAPDEEVYTKSLVSESLYEQLEQEAHAICGMELVPISATKAEDVTPSGNITYRDSTLQMYTGCYGMSVRANRLTKKAYGHCDENGDFVCDDSFKYNWTYNVYFSRTDFEMRRDTSNEEFFLKFSGYHGPLNLVFRSYDPSSEYYDCVFYCEILKAACQYYYGDIYGLERPPMKDELSDRLYIHACRYSDSGGASGYFYSNERRPHISIFRDNSDGRRASIEVFGSVIHELTHGVHWKKLGNDSFNSSEDIVKESLTRAIQWYLTTNTYNGYTYTLSYNNIYTGLIKDMIDDDGICCGNPSVSENISGFNIVELENYFTYDLSYNYIRILIENNSDVNTNELERLFDYWKYCGSGSLNETYN